MKFDHYYENKQHGTASFPIQIYSVDHNHPRYVMPLHWHNEIEFIKVCKGSMELFVGNVPHNLAEGDIAVINCKHLHRTVPDNCAYECIVCDLDMMIKKSNQIYTDYILPIINGDRVVDFLFHDDGSELYDSLNIIFVTLERQNDYYQLALLSQLFLVFEKLYSRNLISQRKSTKNNIEQIHAITNLLEWIGDNYTEYIDLKTLAAQSGFTPTYLCKVFKAYTGKTPIDYVNSIRIQNVCQQLKSGNKSVTEIATDNGFNDISYFCKVFKKHVGVSAKTYAKIGN